MQPLEGTVTFQLVTKCRCCCRSCMGCVVTLHIYDVQTSNSSYIRTLNNIGKEIGVGGVFHGGVEVFDTEWSFGYCEERRSGVYPCAPKQNTMYTFRESVTLGVTQLSRKQVQQVVATLQQAWQGAQYELLTRNCLHFCDAFCAQLEVPPIPAWLNRMAYGADAVCTFASHTYEQAQWLSASAAAWWHKRSPSPTAHHARGDSGHLAGSQAAASKPPRESLLQSLPRVPIPPQWQ